MHAAKSRHPVIIATGEKALDQLDFQLPGPIELAWRRQYRSGDARRDGWFGQGWSHLLATELWIEDDVLRYWDEQGREVVLPVITVGQDHFQAYEQFTLIRFSSNRWAIRHNQGLTLHFRRRHAEQRRLQLEVVQDPNGRRVHLQFNDADFADGLLERSVPPRPHSVIDSAGRKLRLLWTDQRQLGQVIFELAETRIVMATYSYGVVSTAEEAADMPDLLRHTDANGHTRTFSWDQHLLVGYTLATGQRFSNQYDRLTPGGRVTQSLAIDDGTGDWFEYNGRTTRVRDRLGRQTVYVHNARQDITAVHDAQGNVTRYAFDDEGRPEGNTDALGRTSSSSFDHRGNLTLTTDAAGNATKFEYNSLDLPVKRVDAMGGQWLRQYDERGNLIASTDPLGYTTLYEVDALGQVTGVVDALDKRKSAQWDDAGNLVAYTDCSGQTSRQAYDALGRMVSSTNALGQTTQYVFDAMGLLRRMTEPDGARHRFTWDGLGNLVRYENPLGQITEWKYNGASALLRRVDPLGHTLRFEYDVAGLLVAMTNENGEAARFGYDVLDRMTDEIGFDGRHLRYCYNGAGELTHVVESGGSDLGPGKVTRYDRDALGRLTEKTYVGEAPDHPASARFKYDALGRLTHADNVWSKVGFAYDRMGQTLVETQTLDGVGGHMTFELEHQYDPLGNRTRTILPDGRELNHLFYGSGHLHQVNLDGQVISDFERDLLYREVRRSQGSLQSELSYDGAGRLSTQRVARAASTGTVSAPDGVIERHYRYDADGRLLQCLDRRRGMSRYRYDDAGRLVWAQISLPPQVGQAVSHDVPGTAARRSTAIHESFSWDPASNPLPTELMSPFGSAVGIVRGNRLRIWQDASYLYDVHGNMVERLQGKRGSAAQTRTVFTWDAAHQLARADVAHGPDKSAARAAFTYAYDALGRRIAKSDAFGTTYFAWDNDLVVLERRGGNETVHLYHPESFVPLALVRNGAIHHLHTDQLGTPLEASNDAGELSWRVTYRSWGNVVNEEVGEIPQRLRFQGQYFDAETGLHYNRFRYYDPVVGKFASQDPIGLVGGANFYQYAPNPTSWTDPWGLTKCCLSSADKENMGPKPAHMARPHRHHVVREMAPTGWSPANRSLILDAQAIIQEHGLDENTSPENFTWAENGCGAHTIPAAKNVHDRLKQANAKGRKAVRKQAVLDVLADLRRKFSLGKFF